MHDPKTPIAPHDCPACGSPAYIPFTGNPQCTSRECQWFDQDTWIRHVIELPDEEVGQEFDIDEDAETDPKNFPFTILSCT